MNFGSFMGESTVLMKGFFLSSAGWNELAFSRQFKLLELMEN
jgi:hypothetical protein